jgi:urocanate hydratase
MQNWNSTKYIHSQGIIEGTISQLLDGELDRIKRYQLKGDLISTAEILNYLDKRNE